MSKDKRHSAPPPKHADRPAITRPADSPPDTTPPALGRTAKEQSPGEPAAPPPAVKVQCSTCAYGQDKSLGDQRRCRALPPQAHYVNRFFGTDQTAGVHALAMWPTVKDNDSCGMWRNFDLS